MQVRYYDPAIGRFLSTDPVQFGVDRPDRFHRYAYAANDPVNLIDPDGREVRHPDDIKVDEKTMTMLKKLDEKTPGVDYVMTSGKRTKADNETKKGSSTSRHVEDNADGGGTAVDVNPIISDDAGDIASVDDVAEAASDLGFTGIITYRKEDGTSNRSAADGGRLHLDRRSSKKHLRHKTDSAIERYYEEADYDKK